MEHINENLCQSASIAELWKLEENEWDVVIRSAILGKTTIGITATFPTRNAATKFIESFGFSAWRFANLAD